MHSRTVSHSQSMVSQRKKFDDNEELVDIEEEESPETADDDIFADEVLDDEE